jgi:hypothetical protein
MAWHHGKERVAAELKAKLPRSILSPPPKPLITAADAGRLKSARSPPVPAKFMVCPAATMPPKETVMVAPLITVPPLTVPAERLIAVHCG